MNEPLLDEPLLDGEVNWVKDDTALDAASPLANQIGGGHYAKLGEYQPWLVAAAWLTPEELKGAAKFTVLGYLSREQEKGGRQDIEKAMHTLQLYLEVSKNNEL